MEIKENKTLEVTITQEDIIDMIKDKLYRDGKITQRNYECDFQRIVSFDIETPYSITATIKL